MNWRSRSSVGWPVSVGDAVTWLFWLQSGWGGRESRSTEKNKAVCKARATSRAPLGPCLPPGSASCCSSSAWEPAGQHRSCPPFFLRCEQSFLAQRQTPVGARFLSCFYSGPWRTKQGCAYPRISIGNETGLPAAEMKMSLEPRSLGSAGKRWHPGTGGMECGPLRAR